MNKTERTEKALAIALEALAEVAQQRGAFNQDPYIHAQNCIKHMGKTATEALQEIAELPTEAI